MTKRIWELDALRGISILVMIIIHLIYDVCIRFPAALVPLRDWGGIIFLLLSGICVTLGSHPVRRGLLVFCCGMLCTVVTALMCAFQLADPSIFIAFGVLHCLGICMLLWPVFSRLPDWLIGILGAACIAIGFYAVRTVVSVTWLAPLGFQHKAFISSDYFPLFPNLGYFLFGALFGKWLYRSRKSLFPKVNTDLLPIRFLCGCGRQSLIIYLLHQPILYGLLWLVSLL